ncbi:EPIPL protein, partial [Polypterus senegalus]|nr:EPIPL protein [Polypterus senegalus]
MKKGILRPGTALVLLEAQAATGFVIDPVKNTKLSVEEAVAAGLVGRELKDKLLSAERAVTGYTDPYTGGTISLFQSLKKDLIVKDHGIRLLEAQIATGGIIDPVHSHRVPVEVAYQRGYFDEEMSEILSDPSDDTKGFFDPNTHENLTYLQLLERCTKDPDTGLCLLNLVKKGEGYVQTDEQTTSLLKSTTTDKAGGKYQGKTVSVWELLHSEYITEEKRRELMQKLKQKTLTIDNLLQILISTIQEKTVTTTITSTTIATISSTPTTTETTVKGAFQGLRAQVSPAELLSSKIIDEETFDKIDQGIVTVEAVSQQDSVKRYLQGTDSIAGVFIPSTKEKMSIYQAMKKGILRPGTALVLLEAQAATGFVIDPVKNTKLSVEEAVAAGLVGRELKDKLLSAERAVTGYTDPYTGGTISLFQSLKKDLIVKDHGIRLLEAQIATGGIIDPVHSHRVPVEVAYQRGYFDEEMSEILSDPSDDTKGFFDPNTHENLTYLQLLERCTKDPDTGLCLLNLVKKGEGYVQTDEQTTSLLKSTTTDKAGGKYQGKTVSVWELLHSEYITEEKRRELMQKLKQKTLTIDNLLQILISTIQEKTVTTTITSTTIATISSTPTTTETTVKGAFQGLRAQVSPAELLSSKIIDEETFDKIDQGIVTVEAVSQQDSVKRYLQGTDSIAGVFIPSTKEKMSIYQAMKKGILRPGTALVLLEAQAATGFVIDPVKNTKLSVEEAVAAGLVGRELKDKLLSAERAVTGYTDPYTGGTISLFQSLKKDLIVKDHGIRLLEAQIATGGIIDPVHSHRVPVEVAYQRGYFDEEMSEILSDPSDDTKGFFDPNTHENLTYLQLLERCTKDPDTGLCLLNLVKKGEGYVQTDEQTTSLLKSTTTDKAGGKYQGKTVSVWELLHSEYITEEKRRELMQKLKQKTLTIDNLLQILISTIQEKTVTTTITSTTIATISSTPTTTETTVKGAFQGLRAQVSPAELLSSKIIDEETFDKIDQGIVTVEAVSQQDSVKRYLQGTDSIAGVFIPSTKEKMSIYQAMKKGILRPGTALVLLEAQAATGFVIDPVKNTKLSVEEAVAAGLVGRELKDKLLSAERAVTGYTDPYTGGTISLFQSLKKDLIVKDHGIRLLEAQIATGGIIDPVHSHRVPVEVAYQRGYFDEEMSEILSDPSDDTKGFFDPNTHENLTYLQLLERCTKDPDTGLCLLNLVKKGEGYVQTDEQTTSLLKSTTTDKAGGKYQGKTVSVWELLHSEYITEEKRRELMQKLKQKTLTIDNLLQILISTIQEKTVTTTITSTTIATISSTPTTTETTVKGAFQGLRAQVSPAELLSSKIIDEETFDKIDQGIVTVEAVSQQDSVKRYLQGTDSIAGVFIPSTKEKMSIYQAMKKGILRPGTALVLLEAQAATGFVIDPVKNTKLSVEEAVAAGLVGRELKDKLLSAERAVTGYTDPYTGGTISLFQSLKKDLIVKDHGIRLLEAQIATGGIIDPVHSHRVPVEVAYQRGYFDEEMSEILSDPSDDTKGFFDPNTHENLTYLQLLERCTKDPDTGLCLLNLVKKGEGYVQTDEQTTSLLKSTTTDKAGGKYQGKTVSVWELLHSEYITEEKRRELMQKLKQKTLTIDNLLQILISTIQEKTVTTTITSTTIATISSTPTTTETTVKGAFQGLRAQVSPAELLSSKIIDEETFDKIDQGIVTVEAVSQQDSVKRYLQGTDSIAGVFIPSTKEKMSIYQAMKKGILRPGTALVLLEAQAATGFVIDPVKNTKLSVEEAVAAGLVGRELKDKLLSAERAVTGYTDPYTGGTISLFQSLKKDLIVKDHGIRLLEAQIATGGIIDPVHSHRVPVEVAYQRGYFDEEMSEILSDPSDDTKGFFDPNTHENLTYLQLLERCTKDPDTGLCLLNLVKKGEGYVQTDEQTTSLLKSTTTDKAGGKYQGKTVSVWELLHSEYITEEKRRELMQKLKQKTLTIDNLLQILISTIQEKTMSIYQAMKKGILRPGTALVLLEAQAATGFVIDPVKNTKLSVEEAVAAGLVGRELKDKLLSAERAVTGYTDPYTGGTISLFQSLKKDLIVKDHGIRLLEAQIATGGIIDPVHSHRVPVEVAYQRGYFDEEMSEILSDPSDDTKGFFDPNTHENLTYLQLLERCTKDPDTGLCLLNLVKKGEGYVQTDEQTTSLLKSTTTDKAGGKYQGKTVSVWELLHSEYITEEKRRELVQKLKQRTLTVDNLLQILISTIQEKTVTTTITSTTIATISSTPTTTETTVKGAFQGLRAQVSPAELLSSKIIDEETFDKIDQGIVTVEAVSQQDSVKRYLQGTDSIAGVFIPSTKEKMSIYQAMKKGILRPGTALVLLEAQAATGFVIDPVKNTKLSVEEAVAAGLVGRELKDKLLSAERAVTGYTDPYTGGTISLFQSLKKDLIVKDHGIRLLEAQIATGGIIDPVHSHRVPVEVAYQRGYFDEEMSEILSDPSDDTKGFFDPNTHENLTYLQLLERCTKDPDTGLCLLNLVKKGEGYVQTDEQTTSLLKSTTTDKAGGKYQGKTVSVWELLHSEYITEEKRRELVQKLKQRTLTVDNLLQILISTIQEKTVTTTITSTTIATISSTPTTTETTVKGAFQGLRAQVSPAELLSSKIIDEETFDKIDQGIVTVEAVSQQDSVKRYLQGTDSIAGVFIPSTKEKMSIYQAMKKGILRPGTALVLLEAQAATGFVIDPVKNTKLSVEEAVAAGLVGRELKDKLLSAERAVTGYTDPYTGGTISLFQSLKKDLIVKDHGIRLLEAQIATGGIIDPVHSHRVPVEVAYQRGYFDEEMSEILSDPSDDTKGFFDPNTHENLTYLQLLERCTKDPDTGLCLLNLVKKGEGYVQTDEQTTSLLKSTTTDKAGGKYQGKTVSVWELLHSEYITEEKRRELVQKLKQRTLTVDNLLQILISTIQEKTVTTTITSTTIATISSTPTTTETTVKGAFQGLRAQVSPAELLSSKIIDEETFDKIDQGIVTVEAVSQQDSVKRYLQGTDSIAGVFIPSTKEKMSIYQAMKKGILRPGTALVLLEAQAATGFVIDPVKNTKLSVEEAVAAGLVGRELKDKLLSAERAVTGYTDPYTGGTISLFQSLKKDLIVKDHGIRLLEAQIATGGIIDPVHSHRVPVEVAYQRGYFDEEMSEILSDPSDDTKGFFDPNTHENLTYLQLLERCTKDPDTGLCLLNLVKKGEGYVQTDEQTTSLLKSTTTDKAGGKYQGKTVSVWELLHSEYITEEKRRELVQKLKQRTLTVDNLLQILISTIQEKTVTTTITSTTIATISSTPTTTETTVKGAFQGLRAQVSPAELLSSKIIDEETFDKIDQGIVTVEAVSQQDSVKRYLQGTDSIAGVFIPSTKEKMSIYQAMKKGILRPGTALVLLEAQAATGFVIDPVKNTKLSVEEAVAAGLVGRELKDKLLSAERAVTGYTDPYTGGTISLFQSLKKDLIVKDHGIRLLEAQIATGGIIDPVHSHRVPVEVAYQRGYFDEEMSEILSDPSDDTKGFFDPNTHENLTYLQLLERCTKDPDTGLCLLNLVKKGEGYVQTDEQTTSLLKSTTTDKAGGKYQGKTVSVWELLHSEYITEEKRRELVQKLKQRTLTVDNLLQILISTIQEKTVTTTITSTTIATISSTPTTTETTVKGAFQGLRAQVSPAELLSSKIIDEETFDKIDQGIVTVEAVSQQDSVKRYLQGTDSIAGVFIPSTKEKMSIYQAMKKGILRPGTALVLLEAQAATGFVIDPVKNTKLSVEEAVAAGLVGRELKDKLLSAERAVTGYTDPYTGGTISLFQSLKKDLIVKDHGIRLLEAQIATGGIIDPVHSHRVPVEVAYQRGYFDEEMSEILSDPSDDTKGFFDPNTHENLTYMQLLERCTKDPDTGLCLLNLVKKGEGYVQTDEQTTSLLKSTTTDKAGGKYQGKTVSVWELLHSEYITEEKRRELMQKLKQKTLTIDNLLQILISTIQEKTVTTTITSTTIATISSTPTTTETTVKGAFQGLRAQVSPAELLSSKIIDEETFEKIDQGIVTVEAVSQQDSVKRYLQGTDSIAGVFIPFTKEKMSIYQAMKKGILRPGTALVLLEAQAATGFVIDPVKNTKLSVEEAVTAGLVGRQLKAKLLSAERAVTGYTDPYTGGTISLFQSLKKDLIVKDHGIRLLEAQIATGGIIDPVHSHRVPVEVAYQRGYFDEEMSEILSDPSDDTKGFFDPNTHENLTYLQLLERCTKDPDTGLCLLSVKK